MGSMACTAQQVLQCSHHAVALTPYACQMVRPLGAVRKYVKNGGVADADGKTYCGAPGCSATKKNTKFQSSKWAEHIVLDCQEWSEEVKAEVARVHPTEKIRNSYVPASAHEAPV